MDGEWWKFDSGGGRRYVRLLPKYMDECMYVCKSIFVVNVVIGTTVNQTNFFSKVVLRSDIPTGAQRMNRV